jgi:hypothetical protein
LIRAKGADVGTQAPLPGGGKKPRLVTTGCLGIYSNHAVVFASAVILNRGEFLLLADADAGAVATSILLLAAEADSA